MQPSRAQDLETTASLLEKARNGDVAARERLVKRYLPSFQRWAHGRLPRGARDIADTDDLVQITIVRALSRVDHFTPRREGAFLAYLRRILVNEIRDEMRRAARRPRREPISDGFPVEESSPLEKLIGQQNLASYEAALDQLPDSQREAFVMRVEMGYTHEQVAQALGSPSWGAARSLVVRAVVNMAKRMREMESRR